MRRAALILVGLLSWVGSAQAELCARPGLDGEGRVQGVLNLYFAAPPETSLSAGQRRLPLGSVRGTGQLASGDLVLLIQMQGAEISADNTTDYGAGNGTGRGWLRLFAGHFELLRVEQVRDGEIRVRGGGDDGGIVHDYHWRDPVAEMDGGRARWQLLRMPQYQSLVLAGDVRALPWDGETGAVIALDVRGEMQLAGHRLNAAGAGFRGAAPLALAGALGDAADWRYPSPTRAELAAAYGQHAGKGEGLAGSPRWLVVDKGVLDFLPAADRRGSSDGYPGGAMARGAAANAGGGGNSLSMDNRRNSGGGGGGGGRAGEAGAADEQGATGGEGGAGVAARGDLLVAGGGGGAGSRATNVPDTLESAGGVGGGIILLRAGRLEGPGTISVSGATGRDAETGGGGGGGGGGSVLLLSPFADLQGVNLDLEGGNGGAGMGPGGAGGGGRLLLDGALAVPDSVQGVALDAGVEAADIAGVAPGYQCQPMGTLISGRLMETSQPAVRRPEGDALAGLPVQVTHDDGRVLAETTSGEGGHFALELPDTLAGEVLTLVVRLPERMLSVDASESDLPLATKRYLGDGRWRFRAGEGVHYNTRLVLMREPELRAPPARQILPGNTEIFLFRYLPYTEGQVRFRYQAGEEESGWRHTFFLDPDCDGQSSHVSRDVSRWQDTRPQAPVCVRVRVEVPPDMRDGQLDMTVHAETRLGETPLPVQVPELRENLVVRLGR